MSETERLREQLAASEMRVKSLEAAIKAHYHCVTAMAMIAGQSVLECDEDLHSAIGDPDNAKEAGQPSEEGGS